MRRFTGRADVSFSKFRPGMRGTQMPEDASQNALHSASPAADHFPSVAATQRVADAPTHPPRHRRNPGAMPSLAPSASPPPAIFKARVGMPDVPTRANPCQSAPNHATKRAGAKRTHPSSFSVPLRLCVLCVIPSRATRRHKKPHSRAPVQNEPPPLPFVSSCLRGARPPTPNLGQHLPCSCP